MQGPPPGPVGTDAAAGTAPKGKGKGGAVEPVSSSLQLGQFILQPSSGIIPVGGKQSVSITFKAEGASPYAEQLGIDISDRYYIYQNAIFKAPKRAREKLLNLSLFLLPFDGN